MQRHIHLIHPPFPWQSNTARKSPNGAPGRRRRSFEWGVIRSELCGRNLDGYDHYRLAGGTMPFMRKYSTI